MLHFLYNQGFKNQVNYRHLVKTLLVSQSVITSTSAAGTTTFREAIRNGTQLKGNIIFPPEMNIFTQQALALNPQQLPPNPLETQVCSLGSCSLPPVLCISTSFRVLRAPESWLKHFFQPFFNLFCIFLLSNDTQSHCCEQIK